jgi:tetratricopeptide (TPR) repeat protein
LYDYAVDTTLMWTAAGAGAAAVASAATVVSYKARSRAARKALLASTEPLEAGTATGTVPADSTVLRAPAGLLPGCVRGRDDLLARLEALISQPDGRTHVLAGPAGTGKTAIALRLAGEAARQGVPAWWVPAVDAGTVTARLLMVTADLGARPGEVAQATAGRRNPADLLWRYLAQRPRWLLVIDSADDPGMLAVAGADAAGGTGWLRPAAAGLVVVTTRHGDPRAWGEHAELHTVGALDPACGGRVLTDLAPRGGTADKAAALSRRLGGLPLALRHAGAQLASEFAAGQTFAGYAKSLNERFGGPADGGHDEREIAADTWELSLDALAAAGRPQARSLLRVLCCLAPAAGIPARMLDPRVLAGVCDDDPGQAAAGLHALSAIGLLTATEDTAGAGTGVTVHPLVSQAGRLRLGPEAPARTGRVAAALLAAAAEGLSPRDSGDWPAWVRLAPHLTAVYGYLGSRLADADLEKLSNVALRATEAFERACFCATSEELARTALRYTARMGADHPAALSLRFRIARALACQGRPAEAEPEFRAVYAAQTQALGPGHPGTLAARYEIARTLASQGQYEEAERELRDLLPAQVRALGAGHPAALATRYEIARTVARLLARQGRYEQAEQKLRDLLDADAAPGAADHASMLATRQDFALVLAGRGQYAQAQRELRDLLTAQLSFLGPGHRDTRLTQRWLAYVAARECDREATTACS